MPEDQIPGSSCYLRTVMSPLRLTLQTSDSKLHVPMSVATVSIPRHIPSTVHYNAKTSADSPAYIQYLRYLYRGLILGAKILCMFVLSLFR